MATNPYTGQACGGATSVLPDGTTADVNYGSCGEVGGGAGCVVTCPGGGNYPTGTGPTGARVGYPSPGGVIARRTPVQGANCWNSPGTLGDNIPQSSTDPNSEIVNIYALQAKNASGNLDTVGWVYQTHGDGEYIQENLGFQDFWGQVIQAIPALSGVGAALNIGGIAPIASSAEQTVQGYLNGHDGQVGSCFNYPLPIG